MLTLHHSNRLEVLADRLIERLAASDADPFAPLTVLVQSTGMARWLSLRIAAQRGICANVRFPMPAAFAWQTYRAVLGQELPEVSPWDPEPLRWRVLEELQTLPDEALYEPLRHYLADGGDDQRRAYDLAARIADVFDQYLVYRPDWIAAWEAGDEAAQPWQSALWRRLRAREPSPHRAELAVRCAARLEEGGLPPALRGPLYVIGLNALPPPYLALLQQLAEAGVEVQLFFLNPCREYWNEIRAARDIARATRRKGEVDADTLYLEVGNPLLASWGKQGQDFLRLLYRDIAPPQELEAFVAPGEDRLLACLQGDILELRSRGEEGRRSPIAAHDDSLQVHACHGPMREVEVLHEQLLHLFHTRPELTPADVVVMTPDIDAYAPYIEAVFATAEGRRRIPYSMADRGPRSESPLIDAFFTLLELPGGRYDANRVLGLLELPALRRRFGIAEEELPRLHQWVRDTGIRWGLDADSRAALGLPATGEHSWRAGLDRLLLGYALPAEGRRLFGGILAYDGIEGSEAQLMGRLQALLEALAALERRLAAPRPPGEWLELLRGLPDAFFAPEEEDETAAVALHEAIEALGQDWQLAGFDRPLGLPLLRAALGRRLNAVPGRGGRFLAGGVTFCAMVPMRSLPFRVVCLIGLNDGVYPRQPARLGFDLMAHHPRPGDRSRRDDDRYLFLEALLSAREVLYLSYVGASLRDNGEIPPSVLVSELLDYLRQGFHPAADPAGDPVQQILVRHPLQAFSRRYFRGEPGLVSYSEELCRAARLAGGGGLVPAPFLAAPLPEPEQHWRDIELEMLLEALGHPARHLLRRRLGIRLERSAGLIETREPFVLDEPASRALRRTVLELQRQGERPSLELLRAYGGLPHGEVGATQYRHERAAAAEFARRLARLAPPQQEREPLPFELEFATAAGKLRLRGQLRGLGEHGLIGYRLGSLGVRDYLNLWLRHLLLLHLAPAGVAPQSQWLTEDGHLTLGPVADSAGHLRALLERYWAHSCRPSRFLPRSALAYVAAEAKGQDGLEAARRIWEGSEFAAGERDDPYHQVLWRDRDPLDSPDDFAAEAQAVLGPILAARVVEK
ncbi:MAG TPA: exodeoxyribonuclease V subunit gamma [Nevskiales bacterium]|nr:exodeoxyribonuclease V subunit gamma [Nevskiales bacterium]